MGVVQKVGMVIHPVESLDRAVTFYTEALGFAVRFRDGDRFCALDAGGVTIALAAGDERICDTPAVSYRVSDVEAALAALEAAGAKQMRAIADGPHERRAVLRDPAGNLFVIYAPRA